MLQPGSNPQITVYQAPAAASEVFNIGSGKASSVRQIAEQMATTLGKSIEPVVTGKYRVGDIRHCFADISKARRVLGYEPRVPLEDGLPRLAEWLRGQVASDRVEEAAAELSAWGLTV